MVIEIFCYAQNDIFALVILSVTNQRSTPGGAKVKDLYSVVMEIFRYAQNDIFAVVILNAVKDLYSAVIEIFRYAQNDSLMVSHISFRKTFPLSPFSFQLSPFSFHLSPFIYHLCCMHQFAVNIKRYKVESIGQAATGAPGI